MKKLVFILLLCFLGYQNTKAQTNDFKWRFGINAGYTQYTGDLNNDIDNGLFDSYKDFRKENKDFFKDTKRKMFGIELERRINQRIGLRLGANIGQVAGSDRFTGNNQYDRSLNFQTDIVDANAVLKFSIFKRKSFINFYALSGVGVTMFDVYADLEDKNGNFYDYTTGGNVKLDDDYETNVSDLDLQKDYDQVILHIPVGLGVRVKLLPRVTASLEVESRFMFSDYLDNVSDSGAGRNLTTQTEMVAYNPNANYENEYRGNSDNKFMDSYHVVRVGLSYNFGKMKNASSNSNKRNSFNSKMRGGASKIKNAIPSRKGKFRAPVFFPSSTPSSLHTETDALIDGGKAMDQAAAKAAAEAEAKAAAANGTNNSAPVSEETMNLIDETLMVVDETIAVIDETVLEQKAITAEINEMEAQILSLEEELLLTGEDESIEKNELIAEIERLEAEVDQAIAEQEAYKAEMEKAQMEALEMLEAANKEIEAIRASEVEVIEAEIESVEEVTEEVEDEVKEEGKKKKKKKKKRKNKKKNKEEEVEKTVEPAIIEVEIEETETETEVIVDTKESETEEVETIKVEETEVIVDTKDAEKAYEVEKEIIISNETTTINAMQNEINRLREEKHEMQMDQIQRELQDIKNTLNVLIKQRLDAAEGGAIGFAPATSISGTPKACTKEGQPSCKDAKACSKEGKPSCKDAKACSKEGKPSCKDAKACTLSCTKACCAEDGTEMIDEKKSSVTPTPSSSNTTTYPTNNNVTRSTNAGTSNSSYSFPKSATGRTRYDYNKMENVNNYDMNYSATSFNSKNANVKQTLQAVANEVSSIGGVVLIKANTTENEKNKMANVVYDINKEFIYNYGLSPNQIDSSVHIAADGVRNVREIYINNNRIELQVFR